MINNYIRKDLKGFKPYHAPLKEYVIKVDANENPFQHPKEVLEGAARFLEDKDNLTRYPDTDNNKLREKIAAIYDVKKANITCGVGSDQLIEYIIKVFLEPDDLVLVPNPSFSMYSLSTTLNHGKTVYYELGHDFSYHVDQIIGMYNTHQPKIVFICSPNNPTGTVISQADLEKLLEVVKCPVVVDEAYSEFIKESIIGKINQYPQLVVLRTFSKAFGLAALRVGYAIASEEMIDAINICKAPYNLNTFSQEMGCIVLDHFSYYQNMVEKMNVQREILFEQLKDIPCIKTVYPSVANFILVKVNDLTLLEHLENNKILTRGYGIEGRLSNCIRISIGTEEENKRLIEVLKTFNE